MQRQNNQSVVSLFARYVIVLGCIVPAASKAQQSPLVSSENRPAGAALGSKDAVRLPPKIESPYLAHLEVQYAEGSKLLTQWRAVSGDTPDVQILALSQTSERWYANTYQWIEANIGPAAAEHFGQWVTSDVSYPLIGNHSPAATHAYIDQLILAPQYLDNLDALMRDHEMYPQK